MGDPKKQRKKYVTPSHPWQGDRIKEERTLLKEYGLKNKTELWKMSTILKKIKVQAKTLIGRENEEEAKKEKELFLNRLARLGIISSIDTKLEDILGLSVKSILDRRLQTIFFRKGLAKSIKQARQFIVHGHVSVGKRKIDVPSYIVPVEEENSISFSPLSALDDNDHPERSTKKPVAEKPKTEAEEDFEEVKEAAEVQEKVAEAVEEVKEEEKLAEVEEKVEEKKEEKAEKEAEKIEEEIKEAPSEEKKEGEGQ